MNVCELMSLCYEACLCSAVACACMAAESQHSQRGNSNLDFRGKSWLNVIREGVSCRCFCPDPFIHRKTEARTYKRFEAMDGSLKANSSESCLVKIAVIHILSLVLFQNVFIYKMALPIKSS